jgi:hypothetical protein
MIRLRPNRHTFALGAMLFAMWYASSAQQNGGAFVLTFLTLALAAVSLLHAWTNLRAVEIRSGVIAPVQEGELVRVPLRFASATQVAVRLGRIVQELREPGSGLITPIEVERFSNGARIAFRPKASSYVSSKDEKDSTRALEEAAAAAKRSSDITP